MIDFRFVCPHCDQRMKCDARLAGRAVRCPGCRRVLTLLPAAPIDASGDGTSKPMVAKALRKQDNAT